jgi:cytochrome o ubiquinol oxidase subunit 2
MMQRRLVEDRCEDPATSPVSLARVGFGLAGALLLAGCQRAGALDPKGPVGGQELTILLNALAIMLAIVIPTILATLGFAWWFRAGNTRAKFRPDFVYSGRVELLVWSIPILTITFLGGLIWIGSHELDPYKPLASAQPAEEVQVVSLDWKWLFIYPQEGVASVNQLVIPAGRPVHFSLTSASVMNVFFVPQLGTQIYTMNGMVTQVNLKADTPGVFYGQSGHFSGDGFSDMHFEVRSLPAADFAGWVAGARRADRPLDAAALDTLKQQGLAPPMAYSSAEPDLFASIASQKIAPGPGPDGGRGGAGVSPRSEH